MKLKPLGVQLSLMFYQQDVLLVMIDFKLRGWRQGQGYGQGRGGGQPRS